MRKITNLILLDCEKTYLQAGVEEACRAAAQPGRFPQLNSFDRIRLRVADNLAALAFRRCLADHRVPHQYAASPGFADPTGYLPVIGGRNCIPVPQLICRRSLIRSLRKDPAQLLKRDLIVPERAGWQAFGQEDLYVFAFISALVTRSREAIKKAVNAGEPLKLLYRMPPEWSLPERWSPLETLVFKTDLSNAVTLTLHGQDGRQQYCSQQVKLAGRQRTEVSSKFFSIGALQVDRLPKGPIGIHNPASEETLLAAPYQWGNVWLYGIEITLAGYFRRRDFHRRAVRPSMSEALYANPCLAEEHLLSLPVEDLKPLPDLFQRAEAWAEREE
jgi:hypothetical protein